MPFTEIKIETEADALVGTFNGTTPQNEKDAKLDLLLTKWVTLAEANNIEAERIANDGRTVAKAAIERMEKKLEVLKAAAKKKLPADFKAMLDFKNASKEISKKSEAVFAVLRIEHLYELMREYRSNGWIESAVAHYSSREKVERFKKLRGEGLTKNASINATAERLYEYEERAAVLMDEAADLLIKDMTDAEQKKAKIGERLVEIIAQVNAKSEMVINTDSHQVTSKKTPMDNNLAMAEPGPGEVAYMDGLTTVLPRLVKGANGRVKTLKMLCERAAALAKGFEKPFATQLKTLKDAYKPAEKAASDAEKLVEKYLPKIEKFLKTHAAG